MSDCPTGKIRYATPAEAWKVIRALKAGRARYSHQRRSTGGAVYVCPACQGVHITRARDGRPARNPWEVALCS